MIFSRQLSPISLVGWGRVGDVGDVELYFTVLTHSQLSRSIVVSEQPGPPLD